MSRLQTQCFVAVALAALLVPALTLADPCLMVYPDASVIYHYDPNEYYTVGPGDSLYDPAYDIGGVVLIQALTNEIAYEVYQAPGLAGFQMDVEHHGYFTMAHDFTLVVDGFNNMPTTYENVIIVFDLIEPAGCTPIITVDGNPASYDAGLGWYYQAGDLVVSTPTPDGMNYSDVLTFSFSWTGCTNVRIWAFADENYNLVHDLGQECFSAFSHDSVVPTQEASWGAVKAKYAE